MNKESQDVKPPSYEELRDCVLNLMGVFDTPVARRKYSSDFVNEVRQHGREIVEKLKLKQ